LNVHQIWNIRLKLSKFGRSSNSVLTKTCLFSDKHRLTSNEFDSCSIQNLVKENPDQSRFHVQEHDVNYVLEGLRKSQGRAS
jgi:hypothetical protein